VAVSHSGLFLSPYDPRVPHTGIVFGLSEPPPPPPNDVTATQNGDLYDLTWDPVEDAIGYQVLVFGDPTGLPNDGAEECLVLARTVEPELLGLALAPAESVTFWVRSVGKNGRLSWTATAETVAIP